MFRIRLLNNILPWKQKEIRRKTKVDDVVNRVTRLGWRWVAHLARSEDGRWTRVVTARWSDDTVRFARSRCGWRKTVKFCAITKKHLPGSGLMWAKYDDEDLLYLSSPPLAICPARAVYFKLVIRFPMSWTLVRLWNSEFGMQSVSYA